jgi:hypothetical protein
MEELQKLIDEGNLYIRTNMQLWVQWFTFFVTVNFAVIGWFGVEIVKGNLKSSNIPQAGAVVFFILNVIGMVITGYFYVWLTAIEQKVRDLYSEVEKRAPGAGGLKRMFTRAVRHTSA